MQLELAEGPAHIDVRFRRRAHASEGKHPSLDVELLEDLRSVVVQRAREIHPFDLEPVADREPLVVCNCFMQLAMVARLIVPPTSIPTRPAPF
jgi:hypothetical protein